MRPRPSHDLVRVQDTATDPAFPCGHVITAVLILGLLVYFATVLVKRPWLRLILQFPFQLKIGLHAGEPTFVDGDAFGIDVNFAARVMGVAEAGQVLCSTAVRELVATVKRFQFTSRENVELKGFPGPKRSDLPPFSIPMITGILPTPTA